MANKTTNGRLIEAPMASQFDVPAIEARAVQSESTVEFNPADILHSIRRQGWLCMLIALPLSAAFAAAAYLLQEPTYDSSALLTISSTEHNLVFGGRDRTTDFEIFQATQRELVSSPYVLTAALRSKELANSSVIREQADPIEWMSDHVRVSTPKSTEIMWISATADAKSDAVTIVNAVVDAYVDSVVDREFESRKSRLSEITDVLSSKQTELRIKRNELKRLTEQLGSSDAQALSVIQQLQVQEIATLRSQLIALRGKMWSAEAALKGLQMALSQDDGSSSQPDVEFKLTESEIQAAIMRDAIYSELLRDKLTAVRLHAETKAAFKGEQPSVYGGMHEYIDQELDERREEVMQELDAMAPQRRAERQRQVELEKQEYLIDQRRTANRLTAEIEIYKEMAPQLELEISSLQEKFGEIGNQSIDVEMMRAEIAQLDDVMGNIAQRREELEVELRSRPRVEVLMRAEEAKVANVTQRFSLAGFAGMLGFAAPFGLILLIDLSVRKVSSSQSLATSTGLEIIGTVPIIPPRVIRRLSRKPNRKSAVWQMRLTESVKRIASRLVAQTDESQSQVLLVTSAQRKEGKTTLATQLALSLANIGRTVLLVDMDLRSPAIHQLYGIDCVPGVCDLLRGKVELAAAVKPTETPNLFVLPAGECCQTALQSLGQEKTVPIFRELREIADFVIVDSCPVLTSSDIGFICPHVDGVILAVRRDVSRIYEVKASVEFIRNTNKPITGAVVVEPDDSRHMKTELMKVM